MNKELNKLYEKVRKRQIKFIIMTGGVLSGLGKGVALASIGLLLDSNLKKTPIKCDGYLNYDPGTMNPIEHGEVFVLDDGTEVDMDFGHYERFLNITCNGSENITMGRIYKEIIDLERKGKYLGKTVKLIPEVSDHIEKKILNIALKNKSDLVLLEIGGTIGDLENELYIKAINNLLNKLKKQTLNIHLTYIPELSYSLEQKTKPAQRSISLLFKENITPDIVMCRTKQDLEKKCVNKIAAFSNINKNRIISAKDVDNIYKIPINFKKQKVDEIICRKLDLKKNKNFKEYKEKVEKLTKNKMKNQAVNIGICGKYTSLNDSYASIIEALQHASVENNIKIDIKFVNTEKINYNEIKKLDGIIIPGGFGKRGIEGKIKIIKYARENKVPFLGLCYGMQLAVVEFARNVCSLKNAHTTEINKKTKHDVIKILPGQNLKKLGGSMRLGSYPAILEKNTLIRKIYKKKEIKERHRHRYEVNPKYHKILEKNGLVLSGKSPNKKLVEFIEIKDHPFFIATQSHPELKSKLLEPHPLFVEFVKKIKEIKNKE
jgi:CTP synthase